MKVSGRGIVPGTLFALTPGGGKSASLLLPPLLAVAIVYFHLIMEIWVDGSLPTRACGRIRIL